MIDEIHSKEFRYSLQQVIELAHAYRINGKSISQTFAVGAHGGLTFDTFASVDDAIFIVEMLEDIDRLEHQRSVVGPLRFTGNMEWVLAVDRALRS